MADPTNFWASFGDDSDFVEVTCDDSTSLAYEVLAAYGIPCNDQTGGGLHNLDIKRMDAIQVIKLSLLEASADSSQIYEPIMSADGNVEFKAIGSYTGLSGNDIYYELQTGTYREVCGGVMVQGGKPLAYRRPVEWKPIWQDGPKEIYDTGLMINNCIQGDFNQQVTIVFSDPHMDSRYADGIDNIYEITSQNPYDSIIGYARYIDWDGSAEDKDTVITRQNNAKILLQLPDNNLGTFFRRPEYDEGILEEPGCLEGSGTIPEFSPEDSVWVEIPEDFRFESIRGTTVDKFLGIIDVYVIGLEILDLRGTPPSDAEAVNASPEFGSADVNVKINTTYRKMFKLDRGTHYVVTYDEAAETKEPYIRFADNSRRTDPIGIDGTQETAFNIDPECEYFLETGLETGTGYILPTSPTGGILVQEIHVAILLETPSIEVYNPDGWNQKAKEVADTLEYLVAPLVIVEEPAPIAFNGTLLDLTDSIKDHDPTTAQSFEDTELERAYDQMSGNGMSLTLSFLDSTQCERLSGALYDYFNSGDGTEATYVCGPGATVELGGTAPNGGIVNSIVYSYQDSNSYTISVNAGPMVLGNFAQIEGGPAPKSTEEMSAKGTIIEDMGNHIYYKVRIDEVGERVAVNMCPSVLRVGDKVQCSVHNNPVEA